MAHLCGMIGLVLTSCEQKRVLSWPFATVHTRMRRGSFVPARLLPQYTFNPKLVCDAARVEGLFVAPLGDVSLAGTGPRPASPKRASRPMVRRKWMAAGLGAKHIPDYVRPYESCTCVLLVHPRFSVVTDEGTFHAGCQRMISSASLHPTV